LEEGNETPKQMNPQRPIPENGQFILNIQPDITPEESVLLMAANGRPLDVLTLPKNVRRHLNLPPVDYVPPKARWWEYASARTNLQRKTFIAAQQIRAQMEREGL
jgi:hypothetical protein